MVEIILKVVHKFEDGHLPGNSCALTPPEIGMRGRFWGKKRKIAAISKIYGTLTKYVVC